MDRRTLLAIALCFLVYAGWQKYMMPQHAVVQQQQAQTQSPTATQSSATLSAGSSSTASTAVNTTQTHPSETLPLSTSVSNATLGDDGKFFVEWNLKDYKKGIAADTSAIDLKQVTNQDGEVDLAFDDPTFSYLSTAQGKLQTTPQGALWTYDDANVHMERKFVSTPDRPYLDVTVSLTFKNKHPNYAFLSLSGQKLAEKDPEENDRQLIYWADKSVERVRLKSDVSLKEVPLSVKYIASSNRYFMLTLVNNGPLDARGLVMPTPSGGGRISLVYPITGNTVTIPVKAYFGPKELTTLRAVEPALDNAVDFGWFSIFAYPILQFLKLIYRFVGNYGAAIIILTVLLKLATYPLTYKSMKSMREMAKLQPQLQKLREKYKDDKEKLNQEMMTLMKSGGYNPAAGCLPMFIQMPVFFALYRVLYSSIELFHAPFVFWIHDLSLRDPYYVTPVLMSVLMFAQQKLTPNTATDPAQQKMLQFMPLIFGAFMLSLPAGLTLYMLTNSLTSIIQQIILNKKLNINPNAPAAVPARAR
jgi:YidC/Oxa1 family membrane protein insertase